jgi:hypothetical protein
MPSKTSVFRWLRTNEEFRDQYTRAKEESADALTDEMLDIADDGNNDWMVSHSDEEGELRYQINGEHIQRSRLRIETRKWLSSKLKPKRYGDKTTTEHTGSLGLTDMSEETLDAKLAELLKSQ